ncbi:MAG TPA: reverse transcriptase/maturase family protein [Nevskia sp.]|nr:reverse transcriptase/maturase family protein [Nevskia sp.]
MAGSQARRDASDSSYAFNVNLNNGNVNWNNRNNSGLVRLCREVSPRECQGVTLQQLYRAYRSARAGKKPSADQLRFDSNWMEELIRLRDELNGGTYGPSRSILSIARNPKAREIHAPAFRDRVVHHLLVPMLEAIWEPVFIHDSYSNRKGKGTLAAVARVRTFAHQVESGQGRGWELKLDISNFFYSIWREKLWRQLKPRMERAGLPAYAMRAVHALLRHSPLAAGVLDLTTPEQRELVPPHKRLANAAKGCGLCIGNLLSQFLANVYLNELDQFVKHKLGARRYVRYVDDFVLIHQDRAQLDAWKVRIEQFLWAQLRLRLKDEGELKPLSEGIDFLGYVVRPSHTTVRRRVVSHARERLSLWGQQHVAGGQASATPAQYRHLRSVWASYGLGHFSHADSHRLTQDFHRRYPWLRQLAETPRRFHSRLEGRRVTIKLLRAA